jgi:hypothetical protein
MVRHKSYVNKCIECGRNFTSTRNDARFHSGACRAKWNRENRKNLIKAQAEIISTQAKIITKVMPDPGPAAIQKVVKDLSCKTRKDLTECKRPDGTHLYTDQDLWILIAKLCQIGYKGSIRNFCPAGEDLLAVMNTNRVSQELIWDFERRFQCKFDDVRCNNQYIIQDRTRAEEDELLRKYEGLSYSR